MSRFGKQEGFGLIEVLISAAILAVVVGANVLLLTRIGLSGSFVAAELTAMKQNGSNLEVVRNLRDTSLIDRKVNSYDSYLTVDRSDPTKHYYPCSDDGGAQKCDPNETVRKLVPGEFNFEANGIPMRSFLTVEELPAEGLGKDSCPAGPPVADCLKVTSTTEFTVRTKKISRSLSTYLTNWRF